MKRLFFTNFYLGLRDDQSHAGTTNTKLIADRKKEYKDFCSECFITQLKLINPKVVVCLGIKVGKTLSEVFSDFVKSNNTLTSLYKNKETDKYIVRKNFADLGERIFILIPHPSYAHINWEKHGERHEIKSKIQEAIHDHK